MLEENKRVEESMPQDDSNVDYIGAIKDLKANTVDKAQYDKLKADNKRLLDSLINGETIEAELPKKADIQELRKKVFETEVDITNLEYITDVLELRDALIEQGKPDPFLPYGHNIAPTTTDIEVANRVANVLKDCVDYANGDSGLFTAELQRNMIDTLPIKSKR